MKLHDTIQMMASEDYKDRFRAEYWQVKIRKEKLDEMIEKYEAGTLDFTPTCPIDLLKTQAEEMQSYLATLKTRAKIEGVDLDAEPKKYDIGKMGTKDDPTLLAFWMYLRKTLLQIVAMPTPIDINSKTAAEVIMQMLENFAKAAADITSEAAAEYETKEK